MGDSGEVLVETVKGENGGCVMLRRRTCVEERCWGHGEG